MNNKNHSKQLPLSVDVIVVGNGPVGATLAALLGRYGIKALVLDKSHDVLLMPRAIALDNEALRILQLAGLAEDAFEKIVIPEVRMRSTVIGQFSRANTSGSLDGHPKLVTFYQPDLEHAMRAQYASFESVTSLGGMELEGLVEEEGGVTASIMGDDGQTHRVHTKYLVGADGASSKVRTLIGQDFQGCTYAEDWLIVDACDRLQTAINHVEFLCDPQRPTPHMPAPGGRERWEFMLQPGEKREDMENAENVAKLLARWSPAKEVKIERKAVYRFHARCCQSFQKGRVFLVGDAAHITPPFVGQGLVAGLRDVANLAWKLTWVLRGQASNAVLNSYDLERRPHAQKMINMAKFMGRLVMPRNKIAAFFIHGVMRSLTLTPTTRRFFEELDIKPKNIFKNGLFLRHRRGDKLVRGGLFPQAWVRDSKQHTRLSDDSLGDGLTLIGFGVDPRAVLDQHHRDLWASVGGDFLQICPHGQCRENTPNFLEDLNNAFLPLAVKGTLVVVRPDRIIMHHGPGDQGAKLIQECVGMLGNIPGSNIENLSSRMNESARLSV
ncbi:3-(3-hydroxyphenyl)propionate hydroxylase [Pseudomonas sp. CFBP13509]|uniref:bifunctional 3-(3-hydroxy-phenyl)propionate/3-hydroxycinnamic acid hydroxylase n=1 Tax=Pseudomonas sp. CFBP13509 TaxID=2184008 RepID=UPI0010BFB01D|nr:bifunctional 3-(3-hydroxy-phenyl)propionate/3-hydroxycinnamic acid hydroxylase [Pseudomonas sp. CFBP13509]TKJ80339.1 3-(3-hydroxyphenyl)propionate hydroxylase [Pseudomonas sp. CFBP13509]